jgi:hypothetical protein
MLTHQAKARPMKMIASVITLTLLLAAPLAAQTAPSANAASSAELTACKATALIALSKNDASIKDIFIDEDGLTNVAASTKVEDTPVTRIIMGEAYLQTNKQDKPRRFLCLIGEKGKVLLTYFTSH